MTIAVAEAVTEFGERNVGVVQFLLSVDWNSEPEVTEALSLLQHWKAKAPIDVADALKLLGNG